MAEPFVYALRPRYSECDMQGIVFNGHYLNYFDCAMTELLRAAFERGYGELLERGVDMVLAETHIRYRAPARFDEEIAVEVTVAELGTTSLHTIHRVTRDGALLVEGTLRHVIIDRATLAKAPIPDWVRDRLARWLVSA
jgi:acyl-CoA thioester hydrolase